MATALFLRPSTNTKLTAAATRVLAMIAARRSLGGGVAQSSFSDLFTASHSRATVANKPVHLIH
jgi:chromosome segregation and condensation protein ScpB